MRSFQIIGGIFLVMVFFIPFLGNSEIRELFSIRITHPRNQELIESNGTPIEKDLWELHLIPRNNSIVRVWVSTLPPIITIQDIQTAHLKYNKPIITQEEYEKMKTLPDYHSDELEQFFNGYYSIQLEFSKEGAKKFNTFTQQHLQERLAFFIDGKLISAPRVLTPIHSGKAIIDGLLSDEEAEDIVNRFNIAIKKFDQKFFQTLPSPT